jgi:hypothetical protein
MHRALRIPEMVHSIVSHLGPELTPESRKGDSMALAALAISCTAFHEFALDALWRYQGTIMNLIQCMPAGLWETLVLDGRRTLVSDVVLTYPPV